MVSCEKLSNHFNCNSLELNDFICKIGIQDVYDGNEYTHQRKEEGLTIIRLHNRTFSQFSRLFLEEVLLTMDLVSFMMDQLLTAEVSNVLHLQCPYTNQSCKPPDGVSLGNSVPTILSMYLCQERIQQKPSRSKRQYFCLGRYHKLCIFSSVYEEHVALY